MRILAGIVGVTGLALTYALWDQRQTRMAEEARAAFVRDSVAEVAYAESLAVVQRQLAARDSAARADRDDARRRLIQNARLTAAAGAEMRRRKCAPYDLVPTADGGMIRVLRPVPEECKR